jgi:pimeloyl-ACP methyl ester carboxylesterase
MHLWPEADILTNGIRLHYYRTGGDKPPVVLCHGWSDYGLSWSVLARELEADYDVIMVDARYHGFSEVPRSGHGSAEMAADLAGLIRGLDLDRPVVGGHSMGAGYVSLAAAKYPDLMRAIVLEDPGWRDAPPGESSGRDPEAWRRSRQEEAIRRNGMSFPDLLAECRQMHPTWDDETCENWKWGKHQLSPHYFDGPAVPRPSWRETLTQITCPLLLFTADPTLGAGVTDAAYADAEKLNPRLERVHVPGVGHHIRFEKPKPYAAAFKAFLARVYA